MPDNRKPQYVEGFVEEISSLQIFKRDDSNKQDIHKRILTIKKTDGQILFVEFRNAGLKLLKENDIETNDFVELYYIFEGVKVNDKFYNNIIGRNIRQIIKRVD